MPEPDIDPYEALLEWLKRGRRADGTSIREIGRLAKIPKSMVGRIETGERPLGLKEFVEMCVAVDLDPREEFGKYYEAVKAGFEIEHEDLMRLE